MKRLITGLVPVLLVMSSLSACSAPSENVDQIGSTFTVPLELTVEKTTLKEAGNIVGLTVPVPTYLPKNYEIQEIYLMPMVSGPLGVMLLISDRRIERRLVTLTNAAGTRRQYYDFLPRMAMSIRWNSDGFLIPPKISSDMGRGVNINEGTGLLIWGEESNDLWWTWHPDPNDKGLFEFEISVSKDFPEEELVRIAESVAQ